MVSGFIETSASITAGVAVGDAPGVGEAVAVGEGVVTGVGVATVVDSEIMPPGTSSVSLVVVVALTINAAVEEPAGVGDAVTVGVAVAVPVGVGDAVTVGVAVAVPVGVGDMVTVGVGVVDVPLLTATLRISSLSSLLRSSRVKSSSAFPSVIVNGLEYVLALSLISVSITRMLF